MTDLAARIAAHPVAAAVHRLGMAEAGVRHAAASTTEEYVQALAVHDAVEGALIAVLDTDDRRPELARLEVEALTAESRQHREQRDAARTERDQAQAGAALLRAAVERAVADLSARMAPTSAVRAADKVLMDLRKAMEG